MTTATIYNGFTVAPIGPVVRIAGGYVQRVKIVDCPEWIIDKEFNAVVDCDGNVANND